MPVTWELKDAILIVTLSGNAGEEPANAILEAMADPRFRPGTSLLLDVRLAKDSPASADMRRRAAWVASLLPRGLNWRCAMVIGPKVHQYGLARMAATHLEFEGMEMEIFQ